MRIINRNFNLMIHLFNVINVRYTYFVENLVKTEIRLNNRSSPGSKFPFKLVA